MKTIYRLLSLNLVLILVSLLCVFPISATSSKITVGGVTFGMDTDNSGTGWSYTASDKKLTLDSYNGSAICASGDLVVYAKNNVSVTSDDGDCGISVSGKLTLTSVGELSVTGGNGGEAIFAKKLDILTEGNASITLNGGNNAAAVKANELTIKAEDLTAKGGNGASAIYFTSSLDIKESTNAVFSAGTGANYAITYLTSGTYTFDTGLSVEYKSNGATVKVLSGFNGVYGDIDFDSNVTISDAVLISQYLSGWNVPLSAKAKEAGDVYYDGEIDSKDAVLLAQYLAGWTVILGKN